MKKITDALFEMEDIKYKEFQKKLVPDTNLEIIGVRIPILRKFSKEKELQNDFETFLCEEHKYYDEHILHSILISNMKDYKKSIVYTEKFLPYIDNWAVCDILSPKIFKKNTQDLYQKIKLWSNSHHTYTVRFSIVMLLSFYLDENFDCEHLFLVKNIRSDEYYINVARAWYFSMALVKQWDSTIKIIEEKSMDKFTHNKSIQKAVESYRITDDMKTYLKTLKM